VVKYRFMRIVTVRDILEAIGRGDVPPARVEVRCPVVDETTGEVLADFELELPDEYTLSSAEEERLKTLMASMGFRFKERIRML